MTTDDYPPIPCINEDEDLANIFGCHEMEIAALDILKRIIAAWDWETPFSYESFGELSSDKFLGFIMLAAHGWFMPDYPNGMFIVHLDFARRLNELLVVDKTRRHLV